MRLTSNGTSFLGDTPHARHREPIRPECVEAVLLAWGYRAAVAREAAHGELSIESARRLGRGAGLLLEEPR